MRAPLTGLVLVPLSVALAAPPRPAAEELKRVPQEGITLKRTFELEGETESDNTSEHGTTTSSHEEVRALVVLDTITAANDERVLVLERTYDDVEWETEGSYGSDHGGDQTHSSAMDTELAGAVVTFTWDEEEGEYVPTSDDLDDDDLEDLPWDLGFVAFLPDGAVEEGDEWEIEIEAFQGALDPWGGIPWDRGDDGDVVVIDDGGDDDKQESVDGEVQATYAGTREIDGILVAVITIEAELETEIVADYDNEFDQGSSTAHQEMTATVAFIGELLWNVEKGHLHSLEIDSERESSGTWESVFTFGDQEFESSSEVETEGTNTLRVTVEEVEG